jgi:hypothetical protein
VGRGRPKHPSFTAGSSRQLVEDLHVMTHLYRSGQMDQLPRVWRSQVMVRGLLVYNKKAYPGKTFFSMGAHASCCCLWPAERVKFGEKRGHQPALYRLKAISGVQELVFVPVISFEDWSALVLSPVSPMHLWVLNNYRLRGPWPDTLGRQITSRPAPLLEVAAKAAFWDLGLGPRRHLARQPSLQLAVVVSVPVCVVSRRVA